MKLVQMVKDWIFAYKVCKKYGVVWNPFKNFKNAEFEFTYWREFRKYKCVVRINPLYPTFIDSFLHEIGHCIYHRNIYMTSNNSEDYEVAVDSDKMKDEYLAWRFAKLVLKQRFNKNRARSMFKTYFPSEAKKHGSLVVADKYAAFDYNLSK